MSEDEKWMQIAIFEANKAKIEGEIPVGAVIVKDGLLIAQGHNQPITLNDPTAHAEIQVLRLAAKDQKNYRLNDATIYVTLEPCLMCFGAMNHARIKRLVFGAYEKKTGVCGSTNSHLINHKIMISGGVLKNDCSKILKEFFINKR
tara:strand:+ start:110 stop:547 length:438 start_codon:yes stop_codon:yes gene_type:complete